MPEPQPGLSFAEKVRLFVRIWSTFVLVRVWVHRRPLPRLVQRLRPAGVPVRRRYPPALLSLGVHRALHVGGRRPTCIVNALVLFRLLHRQGDSPEVVIGLLPEAPSHRAHAWVELDGVDVGPPPGRAGHRTMARFG